MRKISLILVFLFALSACQKKNDDFVSDSLKEVVSPQQNTPTQQKVQKKQQMPRQTITPANAPKIPPIGIKVDQTQIIIDTNQTKRFLESLSKKMDQNFKQLAQDLKKNKIKSPNETGIVVTQDRIEIDLNKTQKFMEKWIKSMESIGKQLDNVARELDKTFNP